MASKKRRGRYDHIPALAGLPDAQQKHLYRETYREVKWSWRFCLTASVVVAALALVTRLDHHLERMLPSFPKYLIVGTLYGAWGGLLVSVNIWYDRHVVAPRIWRRLPHLCDGCGYDLTGNTSGRCPECGREVAAASSG